MKTILLSILWALVKSLVGAGLGKMVLDTVQQAAELPDKTGAERREWAHERLRALAEVGLLAVSDLENKNSLINLAIEAAVQKIRG